MEFMKKILHRVGNFMREYAKLFLIMFGVMILSTVLGYVMIVAAPESWMNQIREWVGEIRESIIGSVSSVEWFPIFMHNVQATLRGFVLGLVPFLYLPFFALVLNGLILGVFPAYMSRMGMSAWKMYVFGILPHGIFEIPALVIGFTFGMIVCRKINLSIRKKAGKGEFTDTALSAFLSFFFIVVPLLLAAGLIEGLVTPLIINKFGFY